MSTDDRKKFESLFIPLYRFVHAKNSGFKEKEAIFLNQNKIAIFRGDDLIKFLINNSDKINQLYPEVNKKKLVIQEEDKAKDAAAIAKNLIDNKIIMRLERNQDDPGKRWPKKLQLTRDQRLSDDSFYTWNVKYTSKMNTIKMSLILFFIFMVLLYPIWPFAIKFAVFKVSLYLLIFMLGFLILRIVVYAILRLFGICFWILPNLEDDSLGFWASFQPLLSFGRANDGKIEIGIRLLGFIALIGLVYFVSQNPDIMGDVSEAGGQTIDDIIDWGKNKLEGKQEPLHKRAIPDLSELMKEDVDENENKTIVLGGDDTGTEFSEEIQKEQIGEETSTVETSFEQVLPEETNAGMNNDAKEDF